MPNVHTSNFNVACAVFGIFATLFALVSYLIKERLFISESLIALVVGVIAGPHVGGFIEPSAWVRGGAAEVRRTTLDFTRIVLSIQVMLAGVQLPAKFTKHARRPLGAVLGPGMVGMWVTSSLLIWAICVPTQSQQLEGRGGGRMPFLHAMAIGACVTPTDPVLAVTVIKGRWADLHVPNRLSQLISAESGANDGLGYPFLFLVLYLIKYVGGNGQFAGSGSGGAGEAMKMFFGENVGFVVLLSVAWGIVVGYLARKALTYSHMLGYIDRESLFAFSVILSVLIVGTCGMVGSDDILACFVAGNVLSWDDWLRKHTVKDSFEPTIDVLLNWAIFIWLGAVCPWRSFAPSATGVDRTSAPLSLWRLACLVISILTLRRIPSIFALHKLGLLRPNVGSLREAFFMGYFGPIGVSAIFYLHIGLEYLQTEIRDIDARVRDDATDLYYLMEVCVWFTVVSSVIVFGLSIFAYSIVVYAVYHVHPRKRVQEHPYRIGHFIRHLADTLEHNRRIKMLADEEKALKEEWLLHHKWPGRVEPMFRRTRVEDGDSDQTGLESSQTSRRVAVHDG
ncbi:hypothetical protein N658DRAFT_474894 [Parathielavia hyrcaniae]|uniref:Cation/H+ exchanger transmembrane domain-containing protein n=1 Tax=Parathielavia hyrcaniae TaxID=113614 RepID=A0AAN6PX06_9PEZI|nr:hypothetical protein N658DRAFT_474894 [Parathielavia hyrcaniae]